MKFFLPDFVQKIGSLVKALKNFVADSTLDKECFYTIYKHGRIYSLDRGISMI